MALSASDIARIRSKFQASSAVLRQPSNQPAPGEDGGGRGGGFGLSALKRGGSDFLRYLDRASRIAGLGVGTALGAVGELIPGLNKWTPDVYSSTPEAMQAFWDLARQGDWDGAIEAYQDEMEAGKGFWGAAEIAGAFVPTGGPALAGARLISAAPKLAGTLARVAPVAARPGVARGIETGLRGTGKVLRAPWEAEEALGRGAIKGIGLAARTARHPRTGPLGQAVSRMRAGREAPPVMGEVAEDIQMADELLGPTPTVDTGLQERFPFVEGQYEGLVGGTSNVQRQQWQTGMRETGEMGEMLPPRLFDEMPAELGWDSEFEARMARPIPTGTKHLIQRIRREVYRKRLPEKVANNAIEFLKLLPAKYLDNLGSAFTKGIEGDTIRGMGTAGRYTYPIRDRGTPAIINIALDMAQGAENARTIIHEVAHHLDNFIPEADARRLMNQWQKELRRKGRGIIEEVGSARRKTAREDILGETVELTGGELGALRQAYRYTEFSEWFAEVMADKTLRDMYAEIPFYKNIFEKVFAQIKVLAKAAKDFIAKVFGQSDEAERVYRKLINGDYTPVERHAMRGERITRETGFIQTGVEEGITGGPLPVSKALGARLTIGRVSGKRSSQAWKDMYEGTGELEITRADGWDFDNFINDWNKPITQSEFEAKLANFDTNIVSREGMPYKDIGPREGGIPGRRGRTKRSLLERAESRKGEPPLPPRGPEPGVGGAGQEPPIDPGAGRRARDPQEPRQRRTREGSYVPLLHELAPDEVQTVTNPAVKAAVEKLGINPSAARNTEVGRIATAYSRQTVAIDELSDTAVSAALDVHASRFLGRMGKVLPIDRDGYFGQTGKLWNDVFENYKNPAYKLTDEQKRYIEDYTQLMLDVEEMRVAAGLEPRAKTREEGWFYVPRQVKEKGGIKLERPTNPNLERLYEEATTAFEQKGVRYLNDPRETALLHIRAAYKEVTHKQLSDALEPFAISARKVVKPHLRVALKSAIDAKRAAERAVGELGVPTSPKARLTRQQRAAKDHLNAMTKQYTAAKKAFDADYYYALHTKGEQRVLFGQNQVDKIDVRQWRKKYFRVEDFEMLGEALEVFDNPLERKFTPGFIARTFQTIGNTIRFLASVGDFAMPLIHGLPLLARNPEAWGRMTYRHTEAFFNPRVQAKLMRDNLAEYQWLAKNGVPIGDPEFFAALAPGQGVSIGRITEYIGKKTDTPQAAESFRNLLRGGGKQTFGRFQAAYNTGLGYGRVQLLKGLRGTWKGTDAELAQYIRNMTGGLDSRSLGVGPGRRAAEGMWLAFSPRLLRSTIALVADAARPNTPQGREAFRTLATLVSGAMTMYAVSGYALGKSSEEIREGMNPLNGRRFLSHNINGDWIGIGGQVRALTQFMSAVISAAAPGGKPIESIWTGDMYENPFMRFYASRGAPGVSMAAGTIEALTGADVLPFEKLDTVPELFKHLGKSALPFTLQLHLEQGELMRKPSGIVGGEFFGLRGGTDPLDKKSQEIFGEEYRYVEPFMQRMVRETVEPEESAFGRIERERRAQLLELLGEVRSGERDDPFSIWMEVRKINNRAAGARGEAGQDIEFDAPEVEEDEPGLLALTQRNALFDDPEVVSETGRMQYVTVGGKRVSVFDRKLAELEKTWTADQKNFVVRNTNTRPIPIELVAMLPKVQRRDIGRSQTARETYLIDMGKPELAKLLRRQFSLDVEDE